MYPSAILKVRRVKLMYHKVIAVRTLALHGHVPMHTCSITLSEEKNDVLYGWNIDA